jgi:uncharacterized protein YjdB
MANMQAILDTIRANASTEYQTRVPEAARTNIEAVGNPILEYQNIQNEFLNALVNRIALTIVANKTAKNPLAVLKKGSIPLGSDIQEIFTNMAKDAGYDRTGSKLLTVTKPDVKALYYRVNREGQYPVTIYQVDLQRAFTSWTELENLMTSIVTSLYSGDTQDEFILMKSMFAKAIDEEHIVTASISHVKDETTGKALVKAIKKASKAFTFMSHAFNKYYDFRPTKDTGRPVETWTPVEDQVLVIRADVMTDIDVDVLAAAFNMDKVKFMGQVLEVDSFGSESNCVAVLCDRSFIKVYDTLNKMTDFFNPQGMYYNYWLNHHQVYGYSLFANAIAFVCDDEAISLNKSTTTLTTEDPETLVATTTPVNADVSWISSDETVATVAAGVVTPVANGTAVIFAVNGDKVASCTVTVNIPA